MSADTLSQLISLITDTKEQLIYLHELGLERVEMPFSQRGLEQEENQRTEGSQKPSGSSFTLPDTAPRTNSADMAKPPEPGRLQKPATTNPPALFGDLLPESETLAKSGETFEQIWAELVDCTRCPLHEGRTNIVHTEGNRNARLMFIGEAPGADEDAQARPFVGRAGQLLIKIIEALGLSREDVVIGNVNRCRPPGNRPPTGEEASICKPFLQREIALVQPEVIVVLGNTAMKNLLGTREGITKVRGQFQDFKGIKVMPTFHPAYLLRDPSKKRETWEDLKKVRDYLDSTAPQ